MFPHEASRFLVSEVPGIFHGIPALGRILKQMSSEVLIKKNGIL